MRKVTYVLLLLLIVPSIAAESAYNSINVTGAPGLEVSPLLGKGTDKNSTCVLTYGTDGGGLKITVSANADLPGWLSVLTVEAKNLLGGDHPGTAQSPVTLDTTGGILIMGIGPGSYTCNLEYAATIVAGTWAIEDTTSHTPLITYTITAG